MASSSESASGKSFESRAQAVLARWTSERELWASPDDAEAARRYLERLGIKTAATTDGRFVLERTGQVVGRAELVLFGLRQIVARRPRSAPW